MINKFCTNCGSPITEENKFCPNCGEKFEIEETPVVNEVSEEKAEEVKEEIKETEAEAAAVVATVAAVETSAETAAEDVVIKPIIDHYEKFQNTSEETPIENIPVDSSNVPVIPAVDEAPKASTAYQYTAENCPPENNTMSSEDASRATVFGVISLVLFFSSIIVFPLFSQSSSSGFENFISTLSLLFPVAGIVLMIVGRVKYPKSKFLKVVMWIIIVCSVLTVFAIIAFALICMATCAMCGSMG